MIECRGEGTVSGRVKFSIGEQGERVVDFVILTRKGCFQCESRLPSIVKYARSKEIQKDDHIALRGMLTEDEGDPVIYVRNLELTGRPAVHEPVQRAE